ncbi:MAG: hypothetical protein SFY66_25935 [Oculatellaceae cyanobacterium bins.114]|nr:hypothetical protein [Oculatellaceae cyanobacterium bins.114]
MTDRNAMGRNPVNILEQLLSELIPGNYNTHGQSFQWRASRDFSNFDFSDFEQIEAEFSQEYDAAISQVQTVWGQPNFRGTPEIPGYPKWYWIRAIRMCYWKKDEGIAYVSFHREDRELPFEITLGVITEEAIEEINEFL